MLQIQQKGMKNATTMIYQSCFREKNITQGSGGKFVWLRRILTIVSRFAWIIMYTYAIGCKK